MEITAGSWYSGALDGFAYAAKQIGIKTLYHVESNKRAYPYLQKNYPGAIIYGHDEYESIKSAPWTQIFFASDPCQPHSNSGKRGGKNDDRYRWPHFIKWVKYFRPDWVINENVIGTISNLVLDEKISDLENIGYTCQAYNIPACAVNADHERKRVFLVAYSNALGSKALCDYEGSIFTEGTKKYSLDTQGNSFLQFEKSICEPAIFPLSDGLSNNIFELGAIGNSIVYKIPLIILTAIKWMYEQKIC